MLQILQCKKCNIWVVLIGILFLFASQVGAKRDDWNIKKSKHFIIYYQKGSDEYISQVARYAERYYKSITDYLGFRRFNFWTWKKRCKIYFYLDREEYLKDTNVANWSRASVHVIRKEIATYVKREQFVDYILPHELGHIIFREEVGFDKELPLWLDEGIAVLQEKDRKRYLAVAREMAREGGYAPLDELSKIRSYEQISPLNFYAESASLVEFLLREFGGDRFVTFCRRLRDRGEWEEALRKTYKFEDLKALEEAWVRWLVSGSGDE